MRTRSACAVASQNARLSVSRKRIAYPFKTLFIQLIEQHAVEAAVAFRLANKVVTGSENDAALFGACNARSGASEITMAAQPDFDKDQGLAVTADQVDFATTNAEIACHDA